MPNSLMSVLNAPTVLFSCSKLPMMVSASNCGLVTRTARAARKICSLMKWRYFFGDASGCIALLARSFDTSQAATSSAENVRETRKISSSIHRCEPRIYHCLNMNVVFVSVIVSFVYSNKVRDPCGKLFEAGR